MLTREWKKNLNILPLLKLFQVTYIPLQGINISHLGKFGKSSTQICLIIPGDILLISWRVTSWWFQPHWKICSSNWESSPIFGVKIKNVWNHHPGNLSKKDHKKTNRSLTNWSPIRRLASKRPSHGNPIRKRLPADRWWRVGVGGRVCVFFLE